MAFTSATAFRYLSRAQEQGRLAHAYLISGSQGSGKRALASDLANLVNGTRVEDVFTSRPPDVYVAEPESKSRRIVIEQVRALEHALQMRTSAGRRKVAIIAEADRLQPQAANAFLKTLEEPPNDSLLLLLSAMPEMLPDTVLSRCIGVSLVAQEKGLSSPEELEFVQLLGAVSTQKSNGVQQAYRIARGFQRLLAQIRESIQAENAAALKEDESRYKNRTDGSWLEEREDYFKALAESQYIQRRSLLLETLFLWWSDVLRALTGIEARELPAASKQTRAIAQNLSVAQVLQRIRSLEQLRDHLGRNIQEALAIEVAFLRVFTF